MVFDVVLEASRSPLFPDLPEPLVRHELAAAAADLRHLQGFLAYVGGEIEHYERDAEPKQWRLRRLAARLATRVGKLAAVLEAAVS